MQNRADFVQSARHGVFDCVGYVVVSLGDTSLAGDKLNKLVFELYRFYARQYHIIILQHPGSELNLSYVSELSGLGIPVELGIHAGTDSADLLLPAHRAKIDVVLVEHAIDSLKMARLTDPAKPIHFWRPSSGNFYFVQPSAMVAELPENISPQLRDLICKVEAPILDLEHIVIDEGRMGEHIDPLVTLDSGKGLISSNCSGIGERFSDLVHLATLKELPFNLNACLGGSAPICELMSTARSHGKIKCVEAVLDSSWSVDSARDVRSLLKCRRAALRGPFDLMSFIAFGTTVGVADVERIHPDLVDERDLPGKAGLKREVLRLELTSYGPSAIIEFTDVAHHEELGALNPGQTGIFVTLENGKRWGAYGTDLTDVGRRMSLLAQLVDRNLADILDE